MDLCPAMTSQNADQNIPYWYSYLTDGILHQKHISSALAMELWLFWLNPSFQAKQVMFRWRMLPKVPGEPECMSHHRQIVKPEEIDFPCQ